MTAATTGGPTRTGSWQGSILFAHPVEVAPVACLTVLVDAGYDVQVCMPAAGRPCYLLERGDCPVAAQADDIVYSISPIWQRDEALIAATLESAYPDSQIILQSPGVDEPRLVSGCLLVMPGVSAKDRDPERSRSRNDIGRLVATEAE
jgi:hypothetical protein